MTGRTLLVGVAVGVLAGAACSSTSETTKLEPTGAAVGVALVASAGGTLKVSEAGREYAGATLSVGPGVFDAPTRVEALLLPRAGRADEEMASMLAVVAERPFGEGDVELTIPRRPVGGSGLNVMRYELLGYAAGLGRWQVLHSAEKPLEPLTGTLGALRAAAAAEQEAGMRVVGETTTDVATAVRESATGVALSPMGLDFDYSAPGSQLVSAEPGRSLGEHVAAGRAFLAFSGAEWLGYLWLTLPRLRGADDPPTLKDLVCAGDGRRAVVIHGVMSHTAAFEGDGDIIRGLAASGFRVGRFDYPSGYRGTSNGARLAELLRDARAGCDVGAADLAVVGHSMGGLVTRSAMQEHGAEVHRLVMLSTPNDGGRATGWLQPLTSEAQARGGLEGPADNPLTRAIELIQKSSPGLGVDLLTGSAFIEGLAESASVCPQRDRYHVITGWSSKPKEPQANDGLVELRSALRLPLGAQREHYVASDEAGSSRFVEVPRELPSPLEGQPADAYGHSTVHQQADANGVLGHIRTILETIAYPPASASIGEGDDPCAP